MENIIAKIREELRRNVDEKKAFSGQRFFKEEIKCHGVRNHIVRKISKDFFKLISSKSKSEIFRLCDALWESGYIEEAFIACHWSYFIHKKYEREDFAIFERWIKSIPPTNPIFQIRIIR